MTVFWVTLALVYLLAISARTLSSEKNINGDLLVVAKPNKIITFIIISVLVFVSGLRSGIGDTYVYKHTYTTNTYTLNNIDFSGEFGFDILQALLQKISSDPQILIFFCALITNALIVLTVYKYSELLELAIFFYITSGIYLVTMNGMRQYLAASITFAGTHYLFQRDWKKYFLIVLFAATFHQSALVLIPAYFVVGEKAWERKTFVLLGMGLFIIIFYQQVSPWLFGAMENTRYEGYENFDEGGASPMRVLVTLAPLIVAFLGRERLEKLTPYSDIMVNMSILGLFFMIVSMQSWIFARIAIYFNLYQAILISWIVSLFIKKDQKLVYILIIVCYLIYFYYEHVVTLNMQYRSNFF